MIQITILLAVPDADVAETLSDALKADVKLPVGKELMIHTVCSEKKAIEYLQIQNEHPYSLVIVHLGLPRNSTRPRNDKDQLGLSVLEALNAKKTGTHSILISPIQEDGTEGSILRRLLALDKPTPEFVEDGKAETLARVVAISANILAGVLSAPPPLPRLVITLRPDKGHSYDIEIGPHRYESGNLTIDSLELDALIDESKDYLINSDPQSRSVNRFGAGAPFPWETHLRRIGRRLSKEIFDNNYLLSIALHRVLGLDGTAEVCFDVSREVHPALLEALLEPRQNREGWRSQKDGDFWMLRAPIYRRLFQGNGATRRALFHGPLSSTINCLVIESDVEGVSKAARDSDGASVKLRSLPKIRDEASWLETDLSMIDGMKPRLNVERLNKEKAEMCGLTLRELVRRTLENGTCWELVHYAGHSHYDGARQEGYLFFPPTKDASYIEALELAEFSSWLRDARFVYLSGCDSSADDFVFELADSGVPAAFGFRCKIEDGMAFEFTKSFYTSLFTRTRSLEYAFLEARQDMWRRFKDRRVWTMPLLMMQTSQNETFRPMFGGTHSGFAASL